MKLGRLSDITKAIKLGGPAINKNIGSKPIDIKKAIKQGSAINFKSFGSKPLAFVLLAFVIGATVSQGSFAFADDSATNPFRAIWDAIGELQVKTESLQAQIDDLKSQQGTTVAAQTVTKNSEVSLAIDVAGGDDGQTLITLVVANAGPDSAVGVKLTTFYETSLLRVNFIDGAECSDGSRGIIECYLGTITEDSESRVVIDATPVVLEQRAIVTADISSITDDSDLSNNHAESVFVTSFTPIVQPSQEEQEEQPSQEPEETGEQSSEEQTGEEESEPAPEEQEETGEEQPAEQPQEGEETSEEGAGEEQPQEGEQTSEEGTGESTEQGGEEGSSESEGAESTGEQSGDAGESGAEEGSSGEESSGDEGAGEGSGDGEASSGDAGDGSESGSDSGDSGSTDSGSGDAGSGDSGGDSGDSGSSGGDSGSTG